MGIDKVMEYANVVMKWAAAVILVGIGYMIANHIYWSGARAGFEAGYRASQQQMGDSRQCVFTLKRTSH